MPNTNTPASNAADTDEGKRNPVSPRPKDDGMEREVSSGEEPVRGGVPRLSTVDRRRFRRRRDDGRCC